MKVGRPNPHSHLNQKKYFYFLFHASLPTVLDSFQAFVVADLNNQMELLDICLHSWFQMYIRNLI